MSAAGPPPAPAGPPQGRGRIVSGARPPLGARRGATQGGQHTRLAYVGLGSNLAHPRRQIARAVRALAHLPRTRVLAVSPNYASAPLDAPMPQPDYVNAVAMLRTGLSAQALLLRLFAIEREQRRIRVAGVHNAPRTLDLDLLLFGRLRVRQPHLTLPHPRMHRRAFVLRPLADLDPTAVIPGYGPVRRLLRVVSGQRIERTRSHRAAG